MGQLQAHKRCFPYLYLVTGVMCSYIHNDMQSSTNAFLWGADRTAVHVSLSVMLMVLGIYALTAWKRAIKVRPPLGVLLMTTLWIAIDNLIVGADTWASLTHVGLSVWWVLAFVFAYDYFQVHPEALRQFYCILLVMFCYYAVQVVAVAIESRQARQTTTVLGLIYRVLVLVPFLYFIKKPLLRNLALLAVLVLVVLSMKRGAMLAYPLMVAAGALTRVKINQKCLSLRNVILVVAASCLIFWSFDQTTDGFLSSRFSWEALLDGSNRSTMYRNAVVEIANRDGLTFLLGRGSGSTNNMHNEILEFSYAFGAIGLMLHGAFIWSLILRFKQLLNAKAPYAVSYAVAVVYVLCVSLYSGFYLMHGTAFIMLFFGVIEACIENDARLTQSI